MVELRWVLTRNTFPALAKRTRRLYIALDGETSVGRVYSLLESEQNGKWKWCMTATRDDVGLAGPMTGEMPSREEAKRRVEEAYAKLLHRSSRS
jgi:hypothetical protein